MKLRSLFATILLSLFIGCNNPPETEIKKAFGSDGTVTYNFSGTDSDPGDFIDHISVTINNSENYTLSNNTSHTAQIIQGSNSVEAIAYDSKGSEDPTPATDNFTPLTEEEAKGIIDPILIQKSNTYKSFSKDASLSPGNTNFIVDYLITKLNNTDAVINYVGYKKNLESELSKKGTLDSLRIPEIYMIRLPKEEVKSKLIDFINRGYR